MKITGHRGAKGLAPENTISGLLKALEHDVDEIECDVRVTKDHVTVLIHDQHLTDPAGNQLDVHEHTLEQLRQHKADLPTLAEAIQAIDKLVPLVIEVKPGEDVRPVVQVLEQHLHAGWEQHHFLLASFSYQTLRDLHAHLPHITKVVNDRWSGVRATWRARRLQTKRITMNQRWLWSGFVRGIARGGYQLNAYTLNDTARAEALARSGLHGIVTDFPDRFTH